MYIHQLPNWPNFKYHNVKLNNLLAEVRFLQGSLLGKMNALGFSIREEATLKVLTQDVIKTSEIEGEKLPVEEVRSSIAKRMGIDLGGLEKFDRNVEGIVEVLLDATKNYNQELTKERLFNWHAALFPTGRNGMQKITVGDFRGEESGVMQVISGPFGKEKVHYEAPNYSLLNMEMISFIEWFNNNNELDNILKAAIAHFWFVTIHPFDDGNGRIARALTDLLLARSENNSQRFYSMSSQIQKERNTYYEILEENQKGNLDITSWLTWFLECFKRAISNSEELLESVLIKANFWNKNSNTALNDRQKMIINKLLNDFDGKLNTSKWAKICKCSQDTALRDISDLMAKGILEKDESGGRSTNYIFKG